MKIYTEDIKFSFVSHKIPSTVFSLRKCLLNICWMSKYIGEYSKLRLTVTSSSLFGWHFMCDWTH